MIVNYKEWGWEVITQRSHGLLAAQIAMQWKAENRPERWMETILAIAEHDDAEVELDGETLITAAGGPLNFAMKKFDIEHSSKLSMLTITKSRYIALLTSMHMQFLHANEAKENNEARKFLEKQKAMQEQWRKELGIGKEEIEKVYNLMEWCDAFSLLLCQQNIQPEKRSVEISTGMEGEEYELVQVAEGVLIVEPWPFENNNFTVRFESREIKQLQFKSSAEFRSLFLKAPVKETVWKLEKKVSKVKSPAKTG